METRKKIINILIGIILTFLLFSTTGQLLRSTNLQHDNYISPLVFFLVVVTHLKITPSSIHKSIFTSYVITFVAFNVLIRFIEGWELGLLALPNVIFILLSIIAAYVFITNKTWSKPFPIIIFTLAITHAFVLHNYWVNYVNFGNFTGKTFMKNIEPWEIIDENGVRYNNNSYKDKILILDFWNTGCAACYRKFPIVDSINKKYINTEKIKILAVNVKMPSDSTNQAFNIFNAKSYSFKTMVADTGIMHSFDFNLFPTTVIIQNNNLLFKGKIEDCKMYLDELVQK